MYIIYYNCYFYKFIKPFLPRWVVTDPLSIDNKAKENHQSSGNVVSNKSLADTAASNSVKKLGNLKPELNSTTEFDMSKSTVMDV